MFQISNPARRILVLSLVSLLGAEARAQSFQGIGDLAGGAFDSGAYGISADGTTVVGRSRTAAGYEAARWRAGSLISLGDLAGGSVDAYAIAASFDGSIIVGTGTSATVHRPLRWDGLALAQLPQVAGFSGGGVAAGISANGRTIIGYDTDGDTTGYGNVTAYRIDDGVITGLPFQNGSQVDSAPQGSPSADGRVLTGRIHNGSLYQACSWTDTTLTQLPTLAGGTNYSQGYSVSADGLVIVGVSGSGAANGGGFSGEACRWVGGQPAGLGDLPGGSYAGIALQCNHDGSLIVGYSNTGSGDRAFIWDATNGMRDLKSVLTADYGLNLGTWELLSANAITPDGSVIVGSGTNPSGDSEGWIARLSCGTVWTYCTAGTTTNGCAASISASGAASASSATGFTLTASNVEGQKLGLFFYGLSGALASPWGAGTSVLCVKSPTQRMASVNSGGTEHVCNGVLASDWNAYRAANPSSLGSPFIGGELVHVQAWFRDPPSPKTTNLSNALSFIVCP
jgi:uncharacterized membrane protein